MEEFVHKKIPLKIKKIHPDAVVNWVMDMVQILSLVQRMLRPSVILPIWKVR